MFVSLTEPISIEHPLNNQHAHLCRMRMEMGNAEN